MDEPPIRLPMSAYLMAVLSALFVFLGATFASGLGTLLLRDRLDWSPRTLIIAAPLVLISSILLASLSAWETIQQARKKALQSLLEGELPKMCNGCGEHYAALATHCPVCGRTSSVHDGASITRS